MKRHGWFYGFRGNWYGPHHTAASAWKNWDRRRRGDPYCGGDDTPVCLVKGTAHTQDQSLLRFDQDIVMHYPDLHQAQQE